MNLKEFTKFVAAMLISEAAGVIGSIYSIPAITTWYVGLAKAPLGPPNYVFGPVWITLYALIGIALYLVWRNSWHVKNHIIEGDRRAWNSMSKRFWTGDLQKQNIMALFAIQWILNVAWSVIFFGLHQPGWAFFEIIALWVSIIYLMINFYRVSKSAAWILVPYLAWVSFAAYLNCFTWIKN